MKWNEMVWFSERCVYDDGAAFTALAPVFCRRQRKRERAVVEVESKGLGSSLFFFSREGAPSDWRQQQRIVVTTAPDFHGAWSPFPSTATKTGRDAVEERGLGFVFAREVWRGACGDGFLSSQAKMAAAWRRRRSSVEELLGGSLANGGTGAREAGPGPEHLHHGIHGGHATHVVVGIGSAWRWPAACFYDIFLQQVAPWWFCYLHNTLHNM